MALRVLLATPEAVPYAKTGGLADVAGALPRALVGLGHDVRLIVPKYDTMKEDIETRKLHDLTVCLGGRTVRVTIETSDAIPGVVTYLVGSPDYFARGGLYGEPDDAERFGLFCRATVELLRAGKWRPQVIHGNDWQTALIPVLLRSEYAGDSALGGIATLHTIHNLGYQGVFGPEALEAVGVDRALFTMEGLEFYGQVNFLKGALVFADVLNTVSKTYAEEIQTPEYGERLEGVLAARKGDLYGILNGLDYAEWDPGHDELIEARYDADDLAGKAKCKAALQRRLGLEEKPEVPLFGLVSRLAAQKGLDLLAEALPHLLRLGGQFALLGTGEPRYHELMSGLAERFPRAMGVALTFDNQLAHQIYAGSDMFVMPSHYEPCGLGQLISLRYGSLPVVRHTGGLADTVRDYDPERGEGNGFSFRERSSVALLGALARGLLTYRDGAAWSALVRRGMSEDFSWERAAREYAELYERARERRGG